MPQQEVMYRPIPVPRVLIKRHRVPPIAVESAVCEARDLGEYVEQTLPDHIPRQELLKEHREEHVAHDPGELFPSLIKRHAGFFLADGFDDDGVDVGLRDDDHDPYDAKGCSGLFGDVPPVDMLLSGIFEVVD